jgi:hypothetical protein
MGLANEYERVFEPKRRLLTIENAPLSMASKSAFTRKRESTVAPVSCSILCTDFANRMELSLLLMLMSLLLPFDGNDEEEDDVKW